MEKLQTKAKFLSLAALGGLSLALVAGCDAAPGVDETKPATVVEHDYHKAYRSLIFVGKVPVFIPHDEKFELKVQQCTDGQEPPKCPEETVDVSKDVYNQYPDGSQVVVQEIQ